MSPFFIHEIVMLCCESIPVHTIIFPMATDMSLINRFPCIWDTLGFLTLLFIHGFLSLFALYKCQTTNTAKIPHWITMPITYSLVSFLVVSHDRCHTIITYIFLFLTNSLGKRTYRFWFYFPKQIKWNYLGRYSLCYQFVFILLQLPHFLDVCICLTIKAVVTRLYLYNELKLMIITYFCFYSRE